MGNSDHALIVIDVQNDFCPGGALAVTAGDEIVGPINGLMAEFGTVVLTQDWHPAGHSSFASSNDGHGPYDLIDMTYGPQVLWPDHCIQGSQGAEFHPGLQSAPANMVIRKGMNPDVDSYSAFFENDRKTPTGLDGYLRDLGIKKVTIVGLATDFCVQFSALDAAGLGYDVRVLGEMCRAIDMDGSLDAAIEAMRAKGVVIA